MLSYSSILLLIFTVQLSVSLKTLQYYDIKEHIDVYQSHSTTEFSKIIVFNGTIFAAGVNAIYKLSYDLRLLDKAETGPVLSSTKCSPANDTCLELKGTMEDTHPSIFLIHKKWGYLFHCGNTLQGFCEMFNTKNLSTVHSMPKDNVLSFAGGGGQNFAFFDDYYGKPALHIGMGYDERPKNLRPMTLSTRFLMTRPLRMKYHQPMSFSDMDTFWNQGPAKKKLARQYKIDYVYGFAHEKFFYFVATHTIKGLSSAKLVRVCEDDLYYFSHTELYLMCTDSGDNITHSKVVTALFDGHNLHVGFKKGVQESVCQYDIKDIDNQFLQLLEDCYEGIEGTHKLQWVDHFQPACKRDQKYEAEITKDFCGHRLNSQIGGNPHGSGGLWNQIPPWKTTEKITDILVTDDVVVATEAGHITKIKTEFELRGLAPPSFPIATMVKGNDSDIIYATKNKIGKFSLTCSLYSRSCGGCVMVADTLGCGWCGDHCATESSCKKPRTTWTKGCPPVIHNFLPKKGSIYGGTSLRIYGQDFGEKSQTKITVTIGTVPCIVKTWNTTRIICTTKPTLKTFTNDIEIVAEPISNHTKDYDIIGEATSGDETFMFVVPIVEEIFTKDFVIMQIKGDHLDLEAEIVITALNDRTGKTFRCKLSSVYLTVIECKLPVASGCLTTKGIQCSLNITVDGASIPVPRTHLIGDFPIKELGVTSIPPIPSLPIYLLIAVTVIVFVFSVFIFVKCRKNVKMCFKKINNDISLELTTLENNYEESLVTNTFQAIPSRRQVLDETDVNFLKKLSIYIEKEKLKIGETQLGKGHFGLVMKGTLKDDRNQIREVAVKTLIPHSDIYEEGKLFFEEAIRMSDFQHPNVLDLVGIAVDGGQSLPLVVTPFMKHGDLLNFLMDESNPLKVITLFDFGLQVAKGMNYLSSLRFVHRDLAARNCLVDEQLVVKVADFGMSRDIYTKNYYHLENEDTPVPVKWMAPESIDYRKYTHMSDVWSYGILLWEIMTRGKSPFAEYPYGSVLKHLKRGRRLEQPDYCPEELYSIMTWCWKWEPEERPTFEQLESCLTNLLNELSGTNPSTRLLGNNNSGYAERPSVSDDVYDDDDDECFSSIENELYMVPVGGAVGGISAPGDVNNPRNVFGMDNLYNGQITENQYETPHSQPGKGHKYLQMDQQSFEEENPKKFLEKQTHVNGRKDTKPDEEPRYM